VSDGRPSVLIAESNAIHRELLSQQLARLGCEVVATSHGAEAVAAWRAGSFALLITDLQMPHLDGYDLARLIRSEEPAAPLPIVALTAGTSGAEVRRCGASGMNECIARPASLSVLRGVIDRWCGASDFNPSVVADLADRALRR
jgi:two-component system sensor histidine kinase EvgS